MVNFIFLFDNEKNMGAVWLKSISTRILRKNKDLQSTRPLTISAQAGLVDQTEYFNKQIASKQLKNYLLLKQGDFAYNKSYYVGYPYGAIKRLNNYDAGVLSTLYLVFKPLDDISSDFLEHYYDSSKWYTEIYRNAAEGARNHGLLNISSNDFFNTILTIPVKIKEQNKIANLLNILNKLLSLQQRKLDQLKQLKKAMLHQLFTEQDFPEIRFNGFTDSWREYKFKEILSEFSMKSKKENEYEVLSSTTSGIELRVGRVSGHSNVGYKVVNNDDIVLSPQNLWLGNINLNDMGVGLVSPSYHTFKIININPFFIKPQLKTKRMLFKYKMASVQGASVVRRNLSRDAFSEITLRAPKKAEQIKIAHLFFHIDNIINMQQNQVNQLLNMKKFLLQNLFI